MKIKSYLVIVLLIFFFSGCARVERLGFVMSLFSGEGEQYQNFYRVDQIFPVKKIPSSEDPLVFTKGLSLSLPESFIFKGNKIVSKEFLSRTDTSALLILKDGKISFEQYWLTGGEDKQWISFSLAKSFISALIGIAIKKEKIKSIDDSITDYVPKLKNSAYNNVRIKDILQMSSGALWNEDYSDPSSDINRIGRVFAIGGSFDKIAMAMKNELVPGTFNRYNSIDTQVLGMLLRETVGSSISEFMNEVLWEPIGAEYESYWIVDSNNMEMAFGGFNATARDYAKLGELYRLEGKLNDQQIVPSQWVRDSITPDAPHLIPGDNLYSENDRGYGYQWWIPDISSGDFTGIGVYNQFIYVSPKANMVIVKLSANSLYGKSQIINNLSVWESIAFFKAIAR